MRIDVPTLYFLIVGTTFVASFLTFWERRLNPAQGRELGLWSFGYLAISAGCLLRILGADLPAVLTLGVSNIAVIAGYAVIGAGVARFAGARTPKGAVTLLGILAGTWLLWGMHQPVATRIVLTSSATGAICAWATVLLARRRSGVASLPSQTLAAALFGFHSLFFILRAAMTASGVPGDVPFVGTNFTLTMFEGILWSVAAPMTLLVLVREKTERQLIAASQTDFLTGLDNRRAFVRKSARLFTRARVAAAGMVVMVFDLDHFKSVNDSFGHQIGDEVLKLFARVAEAEIRPHDLLARMGGEEFAVMMAGCDRAEGERVAARIRQRFAREAARADGLAIAATVSVGLAQSGSGDPDLDGLLGTADRGLYRAKALGRNRVEYEPFTAPAFG